MADGGTKISLTLGGPRKPSKPAPANGVKRSHAALHDDDEEGHEEGKAQTVSHFDKSAGGAVDQAKEVVETGPLVIAPQANRDWKDSSKRRKQRHGLPPEAQQNGTGEQAVQEVEAKKPAHGLIIAKREVSTGEPDTEAELEITQSQEHDPAGEDVVVVKTDDELAMDALLGKTVKQDLVLPAVSEEQAFEQDYKTAPDMATLDDYARVPVEQFGAALLRGMGWKDGEGIGANRGKKIVKTKIPERRPALLGIGVDPKNAAVAQEMGSWGKAAKRGQEVKMYNPVLLRDKKTGQLFTEEELQKKRERDEQEKYEAEFERKERDRDRRRRREEDEEEKPRHRDRHDKDRRREKGRSDDRDGRRNDSDEERHRRKEKERKRRERDREDGYRDRECSKRHETDREGHRSRHSDRDRRR
ncbi:hypothetical protein LTR08_007911 [Meristemomyces frigidus]|nr:hypothetical protein LTR08_007911 [Meristemomyces frigidus]